MNVLDLFCGCGGMSKGITDAGLNIIAGIDIWNKAIENYKKNFAVYKKKLSLSLSTNEKTRRELSLLSEWLQTQLKHINTRKKCDERRYSS